MLCFVKQVNRMFDKSSLSICLVFHFLSAIAPSKAGEGRFQLLVENKKESKTFECEVSEQVIDDDHLYQHR